MSELLQFAKDEWRQLAPHFLLILGAVVAMVGIFHPVAMKVGVCLMTCGLLWGLVYWPLSMESRRVDYIVRNMDDDPYILDEYLMANDLPQR